MAKFSMEQQVETNVQETMAGMEQYLSQLPEHERIMVEGMLERYCWYNAVFQDAREHINREGSVVSTEKGLKENPYVGVAHKYSARASDHFTKIMRVFKNSLESEEEEDELVSFLKRS